MVQHRDVLLCSRRLWTLLEEQSAMRSDMVVGSIMEVLLDTRFVNDVLGNLWFQTPNSPISKKKSKIIKN